MTDKKFLKYLALYCIFLFVLIITVNSSVDPYGIFSTPRISGFNAQKTEISNFVRISKAYSPKGQYDWLIIGNSRVEMGLDPQHSCFHGERVYNLGLPGAGPSEQITYALDLIHQGRARNVLLSVDFVDFLIHAAQVNSHGPKAINHLVPMLKYKAMGEKNPDYVYEKIKSHFTSAFSLQSLVNSIMTVFKQGANTSDRTINGFNPALDMSDAVINEGVSTLFEQKLDVLNSKYQGRYYIKYNNGNRPKEYHLLKFLINEIQKKSGRIVIFTNPFHQDFWDVLARNHMLELNNEWQSDMQDFLSEFKDIALWDFTGSSDYIKENGLNNHSRERLRWFWEPSHYTKELGDLMLSTMFSDTCDTNSKFKNAERLL